MNRWRIAIGGLLGFVAPLIVAEFYVRTWPPTYVHEFLGDRSLHQGIYRQDPLLGADYASYEALRARYADRLKELGPLNSEKPTWAWFGSSFVQAAGMLADTARSAVPDRRVFDLRRNEPLPLRVAQIRWFLQEGLRPERIFFAIVPLEVEAQALRPMTSILVNKKGAITYRPRMPPEPFDRLIDGSALAFLAWVRSGRHGADPGYRASRHRAGVSPVITAEMSTLFETLGNLSRRFGVPVTIILIPNREQVRGQIGYVLQDHLAALAHRASLDTFDARTVFNGVDWRSVYLPDWHFNRTGNELLLKAILDHLAAKAQRQ